MPERRCDDACGHAIQPSAAIEQTSWQCHPKGSILRSEIECHAALTSGGRQRSGSGRDVHHLALCSGGPTSAQKVFRLQDQPALFYAGVEHQKFRDPAAAGLLTLCLTRHHRPEGGAGA